MVKKKIHKAVNFYQKHTPAVVLVFVVVGTVLLLRSFAATAVFNSFEAEDGATSGNVALATGEGTSNGKYATLNGATEPTPTPTPTESPTPTPGNTGYPDETNTGPRTPPTRQYSGPSGGSGGCYEVSTNLDGYIFDKCVRTMVAGLKISNSKLTQTGSVWGLEDAAGGATFEYNYIEDTGFGSHGVGCGEGTRVYRNNIKGFADNIKCESSSQIIENYLHDLSEYLINGQYGTHNDFIQNESSEGSGLLIKGNTFSHSTCGVGNIGFTQGCNGIIMKGGNHTIEANYFKSYGGPTAGYLIHALSASNIIYKDNVFNCPAVQPGFGGQFGAGGGVISSGNVCE